MDFNKPLWEFMFLEDYNDKESVVFVKLHHCWSDAGGLVGLLSCLNDKDKQMKVNKKIPKLSIFANLLMIIFEPIYFIYFGIRNKGNGTDEVSAKIRDLKCKDNQRTKFYAAKQRIPFQKIRACF